MVTRYAGENIQLLYCESCHAGLSCPLNLNHTETVNAATHGWLIYNDKSYCPTCKSIPQITKSNVEQQSSSPIEEFLTLATKQFKTGQLSYEAFNEAKALALLIDHCKSHPEIALAGMSLAYQLVQQQEKRQAKESKR